MKRGQVWRVRTAGGEGLALIVRSNGLATATGVMAVPLYSQAPPIQSLIAPQVQGAYAHLAATGPVRAERFLNHLSTATPDEMDDVAAGLKAVLDLD